MANLWLDLKGPILADTVYVDGVLAAKDVTIALPPVNLVTADFKAMGTYTAPLPGQIEAMEASITKIGIDLGLRSLVKLTSKTIEIRWGCPPHGGTTLNDRRETTANRDKEYPPNGRTT